MAVTADAPQRGTAGTVSTAGFPADSPGTGPHRPGEDETDAALAILLTDHPEAVCYAIAASAATVPMPKSVTLNGHAAIEGTATALDMVAPSYRGVVIDAWERAGKNGVASGYVRLAADPDRHVMLTFLDARARHGVFLGIITAADGAEEQIAHAAPSRRPRLARARKDGLAVLLEVDEAFTQILGWEPEEVLGTRTRDLLHPDDELLAVDNWMAMLATPGPAPRIRLRHRHRDGSWIWIEVTNHNLLHDPELECVLADMVDISDEMATQEALRAREQLLVRLAETIPLGLLQVDADARVVYTNERLHSIVGVPRAVTVEEQLSTVLEEDRPVVAEAFAGVLTDGVDVDIEVRARPADENGQGRLRFCALSLRALTDASGNISGAIVCVTDVTESARAREELKAQATRDAVTGCRNRISAMAELEAVLALSDTGHEPAVIFIDLDHFKGVNDALGHAAGDEFLRVVAQRLRRGVRADDVVGRIGGDEFLVICPRICSAAEAMTTAARLAQSLGRRVRLSKGSITSSASIDVAWPGSADTTAESLVAKADAAMYACKRAGDGKPVLFDESTRGAEQAIAWQWPAPPDD